MSLQIGSFYIKSIEEGVRVVVKVEIYKVDMKVAL